MPGLIVAAEKEKASEPAPARRSLVSAEKLYERAASSIVGITVRSLPRGRPRSEVTHFGTGTLIDPVGLILTSTTVANSGARNIEVFLPGGRIGSARIIKVVPEKEISLLRVDDFSRLLPPGRERLPFLELGKSGKLRLGSPAFSFGNAFHSIETDDKVVMSAGIISAKIELKQKHPESTYIGPVLETTAALNSGMDGGPLVDRDGKLVGLLILNFSKDRWLGTAIPVDVLRPYVSAQRGWFDDRSGSYPAVAGFEVAQTRKDQKIRVLEVQEKGPAAKAGLAAGDVIRSLDGKPLESIAALHKHFSDVKPGQRLRLEVERDGEKKEIDIELWGNF
jgi:serine protease Do